MALQAAAELGVTGSCEASGDDGLPADTAGTVGIEERIKGWFRWLRWLLGLVWLGLAWFSVSLVESYTTFN